RVFAAWRSFAWLTFCGASCSGSTIPRSPSISRSPPMIDEPLLVWLLRFTGAGMLGLALVHHPIARRLGWKEDVKRLRPVNEGIFHSHLFFICLGLVRLGLALAFGAAAFVE